MVLLEEFLAFCGEFAGVCQVLRDRLTPGMSGEGQTGWFSVTLHGPARMSEVAAEKGAFATHLLRSIRGTLHAWAETGAFFAGKSFPTFGSQASFRVLLCGTPSSRLRLDEGSFSRGSARSRWIRRCFAGWHAGNRCFAPPSAASREHEVM